MSETTVVAVISASAALFGALLTQGLQAWLTLRTQRLQLAYGQKAEVYRNFVDKAGTFSLNPHGQPAYQGYLHAYLAARLICSETVLRALDGPVGVNVNAQRLRGEDSERVRVTSWYEALENATSAMRHDLTGLTGS